MNILLIGAAGFVGTNLWSFLIEKYPHYNLYGLDKYNYASNKELGVKRGIAAIDASNLSDLELYISKLPKLDLVIGLQGNTHVDYSFNKEEEFLKDNCLSVINTLKVCHSFNIPYISYVTDEVLYHQKPVELGPTKFYRRSSNLFIHTQFNATSPYSASKLAAEAFIQSFRHTSNVPVTVIRQSNLYGYWQLPDKLISKTIFNLLHNKPMEIYGTGEEWRDYMFITDHCRMMDEIIHSPNRKEVYHLAANDERQNKNTVKLIAELMDKEDLIKFIPNPRISHDYGYFMTPDIKINLTPIKSGLLQTIKWYTEAMKRGYYNEFERGSRLP